MEQLFSAIPAVLKELAANVKTDEAIAFAAWRHCAGELLSSRTTPLAFFKNRLIISVEDKAWQRHMEQLSPQMLAKLNEKLGHGTVKFIEFKVGHKPAR